MGFLDFLRGADINQGVAEYHQTPGAILLDVRTPQEYREGHISDSKNIPLHALEQITPIAADKDTPLFVYCHSGSRSRQAVSVLQQMGYSNAKNIGGISSYMGKVER